jgi:predicted nucleic acid-binding protein
MGLLSGSVAVSRFHVTSRPREPDFEGERFVEIPPNSELREQVGFVPFEPEAPYRVAHDRHAFRVRLDRRRPDPTALRERVRDLVQAELEATGAAFVGRAKRKELRELAAEELLARTTPRSRIIECCLEGDLLYVASTAKSQLGTVIGLLRRVGVLADPKAPWLDGGEEEARSEVVETHEPGESVAGCRFLRSLLDDPDILVEPVSGSVRLQTREAKVTLTGAVLGELLRYVERGAEILSARLVTGDARFRLDALSFRISGLKVETARHDHWIETLDERLEKVIALFDLLDAKYAAARGRGPAVAAPAGAG